MPWDTKKANPRTAFNCSVCNQKFLSYQAIKAHKSAARDHFYCFICDKDFRDADNIRDHVVKEHPAAQELNCPGCGRDFSRYSALVGHWEKNQCPNQNYSAENIYNEREKGLEFAHRLRQQGLGEDSSVNTVSRLQGTISPESIFPPSREPDVHQPVFKPGEFPCPEAQKFRHGDSKVPDLLTGFGDLLLKSPNSSWQSTTSSKQNSTGQALFPEASAPAKLAPDILKQLSTPNPNDPRTLPEHDPDHPDFDVRRYWCDILGWFKCPYGCQGKKHRYESGRKLSAHLNSAHRGIKKKIKCPTCLRDFGSAQALAAHAETVLTKCSIRSTSRIGEFVGELSAGLIKPAGYHLDSTMKYEISEKAREKGSCGPGNDSNE
ncbi:hypothetical protein MKZ38_009015 [Zalerion maritima]|uniref:C2H2-type domain-containing protein n=1 Tax=Zalerion maritima TaxID=339359 RepID=A0AAD5WVW5_9PEZI|nr:hypothetical protein MKZ38_009015 [Zalerion maritima]